MVSARSTTFLLLLVFILLLPLRFSFSCADTHHQGVVDTGGKRPVKIEGDQRKRFVPGTGTGTGRKMLMSRGVVLISKSNIVVESEMKRSSDHYFVPLNADYHDPRHHPPRNN